MYDKIFQPYTSFIRQQAKNLTIEDPFVAYNTIAYYLTAEFSDNNFMFFPSVVMENICKSLQGDTGFALLNAMRGETFDNEREVLQALYKNLSIPLGYLSKGFPWLLNEVMDVEPDWIALREVAKLTTMEETPEGNINFLITTAIDAEYLANPPADIISLSKHLKKEYLKISKRCTILVCPILSPESVYDCGNVTSFDSARDTLIELSKKYYTTHETQHYSDDAGSKHQNTIQDCHEILSEYIDNYLDGCKELTKIFNKVS
jgi:hypothetical protein